METYLFTYLELVTNKFLKKMSEVGVLILGSNKD